MLASVARKRESKRRKERNNKETRSKQLKERPSLMSSAGRFASIAQQRISKAQVSEYAHGHTHTHTHTHILRYKSCFLPWRSWDGRGRDGFTAINFLLLGFGGGGSSGSGRPFFLLLGHSRLGRRLGSLSGLLQLQKALGFRVLSSLVGVFTGLS